MKSANATVTQAPISLLETIARDADLRARLEADPSAVLAELGAPTQLAGNDGHNGQWVGYL